MIVYKNGDLLASEEKVVAHGCNCSGGFGTGFAAAVKEHHPEAREAYFQRYRTIGWELGEVQLVSVGVGGWRTIANCSTQLRFGEPDQGPYVSYGAVRSVIRELVSLFPGGFAIPKIGAGRAGGNWDIIAKIIEEESGSTEVRVYVL